MKSFNDLVQLLGSFNYKRYHFISPFIWFLLFAVSSVGLVFGLRAKLRELFEKTDAASDLKDDFIGRDVSIESGFDHVTPGIGKVNYRGASWKAKSETLHWEAGQIAVVVSRESSLLIIGKE